MEVGQTVSLRIRMPSGVTELVGVVVASDAARVQVRRRDGRVQDVDRATVTAARVVPPGPARRISVADLAHVCALGWRALETQPLGEWLLRASGGFTARANSALAVGDPAIGLPAAVDTVERWYAARGLPPRIQVVAGASPEDLPTVLAARGWASSGTDQVMTAELGHALRAAQAPGVAVQVDEALDAAWLAACRVDAQPLPATAAALLGNHPAAGFASVRADGQCTAIARVAVDGRWAGLFGVEVAEAQRGQGLGSAVSVAALRWATARGARHGYLQVQSGNPVRRLYERWGFEVHHEYAHWEYTHAARASPG